MKKIILISVFLLSILSLSAQTDTLRTKGRKTIPTVIGKWQLDSVSSKKGQMEQTIEFFENGSYTQINGNNTSSALASEITGMWKIENGAITRDGRTNLIENLTMKKLVLSGMDGKKKVFYYYSRMNYKEPRQDVIPH